ncbi:hypothetical protein N7501_004146 [Penicillium viridicatum]|nr:hypothetical protein N7501_004146 [Penicillium viridicatum]
MFAPNWDTFLVEVSCRESSMATTLHISRREDDTSRLVPLTRRIKPLNWSQVKKAFILFVIGIYSFVVYMAAPIIPRVRIAFIKEFGVNNSEASLSLAHDVMGYGAGPFFFSPLGEIPRIGRNRPYIVSFFLFCIVSTPTALPPTAVRFYFLRFLQGVIGSPFLATGGASITDVYSPDMVPHVMTTWVFCVFCAPAIGVLVSGFAIPVLGWMFSMRRF